jgi:hypothetical protein
MTGKQRFGLLAVAAVVAVGAFLILKGGDDNGSSSSSTAGGGADTTSTTGSKPSKPAVVTIRVKGGKPVNGIEKITVKKGERIRFRVSSDKPYEIHFHGYDVMKDVPANGTVTFNQKATIEGVFEAEVEDTGEQIAKVTVNP